MMRGKAGWTNQSLKRLWQMSLSLEECDFDNLWRGQLRAELQMLETPEKCLADVTAKLNEQAKNDKGSLEGLLLRSLAFIVSLWLFFYTWFAQPGVKKYSHLPRTSDFRIASVALL